jgi:hypothetical protein
VRHALQVWRRARQKRRPSLDRSIARSLDRSIARSLDRSMFWTPS